jgi:hypothetical protein
MGPADSSPLRWENPLMESRNPSEEKPEMTLDPFQPLIAQLEREASHLQSQAEKKREFAAELRKYQRTAGAPAVHDGSQFQMIIGLLRQYPDGRTREQIIAELEAKVPTRNRKGPGKAIHTALSALKKDGDIELVGKVYRVTDRCER